MFNRIVEIKNDKVIFDLEYFSNSFIKPIEFSNISGLTLRLMALLLLELSEQECRKLPSRRKLAKILGANVSSVHKCLIFLEENGFFFRVINPLQFMVRATPEEQAKYDEMYQEKIKENQEKKAFNDFFQLNSNFNVSKKEMTFEEFMKEIVSIQSPVINKIFNQVERRISRMDVIQSFLQELLLDQSILSEIVKKIDAESDNEF